MKLVKQYRISDDGCLQLTLSSAKEFDPYRLTMMNEHLHALPCQRKGNTKRVFCYDVSEKLALRELLSLMEFSQKEACLFLVQLWQEIAAMIAQFPVYALLDTIYYDQELHQFCFVVLPIHDNDDGNDWGSLWKAILQELHVTSYALHGYLYQISHKDPFTVQGVVEALLVWQKAQTLKVRVIRWFQELLRCRKRCAENERRIKAALQRQRFKSRSYQHIDKREVKKVMKSDTVVLFSTRTAACLVDCMGDRYPLSSQTLIGRKDDCDIVLNTQTVSGHHAKIVVKPKGMVLIDLDSSNGTKVNDQKIAALEEIVLHHQDIIDFAGSKWVYEEEQT